MHRIYKCVRKNCTKVASAMIDASKDDLSVRMHVEHMFERNAIEDVSVRKKSAGMFERDATENVACARNAREYVSLKNVAVSIASKDAPLRS
jgi:hypothetical protein